MLQIAYRSSPASFSSRLGQCSRRTTRLHLMDAHQRVMSVAAVQQQLLASSRGEPIEIGPYLSRLCETLAALMTDDSRPISLKVQAEGGTASSAEAVSISLIVTELVINAFKHAFVGDRTAGFLVVTYEATETRLEACGFRQWNWKTEGPSGFGENNSWIGHDHRRGTRQTA